MSQKVPPTFFGSSWIESFNKERSDHFEALLCYKRFGSSSYSSSYWDSLSAFRPVINTFIIQTLSNSSLLFKQKRKSRLMIRKSAFLTSLSCNHFTHMRGRLPSRLLGTKTLAPIWNLISLPIVLPLTDFRTFYFFYLFS